MWLDLKDILEVPGTEKSFSCELNQDLLSFPFVETFLSPVMAEGTVRNTAGVLSLSADVHMQMQCVCDRCLRQFERDLIMPVSAVLSDRMEDEDDADVFPVEEQGVSPDEIAATCVLLDMDSKCLCRDDCRGLCPDCGADLNEGPCTCAKPIDPRLAVLEQLLDT